MKILALGPNSTKFCIYNLRASGELEMQKLGAGWVAGVEWREGCVVECGVGVEVEWSWEEGVQGMLPPG